MLDAGLNELKYSFFAHSRIAEKGISPSHFLLLFYAVECGLKVCILKNYRKLKTSQAAEENIKTHDLSFLAKKLRLAVGDINFRLHSGHSYSIRYAHEAWRYGIKIHEDDEKKIIEWLKKVQKKIRDRI